MYMGIDLGVGEGCNQIVRIGFRLPVRLEDDVRKKKELQFWGSKRGLKKKRVWLASKDRGLGSEWP